MENCLRGKHNLTRIYINGRSSYAEVVRWCRDCGAVVVDVDFDGRTNAGQILPMRLPKIVKTLINK